jgi:hypothetical protein
MGLPRMARIVTRGALFLSCAFYGCLVASCVFAAAQETEKPDREMLRLMELLKDLEMLQQIDMMRDMHEPDYAGGAPSRQSEVGKHPPSKSPRLQK